MEKGSFHRVALRRSGSARTLGAFVLMVGLCLGPGLLLGAAPQLSGETPTPSGGSQVTPQRVAPGSLRASRSQPLAPPAPHPRAPSLVTSIEGINFDEDGVNNDGFVHIPPDPIGAAGPSHLVSVVNTSIEWHTKAGVQQNSQRLGHDGDTDVGSFFDPLDPVNNLFDPKVIYDQFAGRFLVVALERRDIARGDSVNTSRILLAVSDDSDPNGAWRYLAINSKLTIGGSTAWADYPGFAVDEEAVYITNNMFRFLANGGAMAGVRLWIVNKTPFYSGGTGTFTVHNPYAAGGSAKTTHPAHIYGAAPGGATGTFLVSYDGLTASGIESVQVVRVDNPLTAPTFAQQLVAVGDIDNTAVSMPDAPQMGTATLVQTNDRRALNAVWQDDSLWMTAQVVPGSGVDAGQATAHWWQLDTTLSAITVTDQGDVGGEELATGAHTFMPAIAVDSVGNMGIGFSISAASIFPGAAYSGRAVGDAAGTTQPAALLAQGVAFYERSFSGAQRWGDYSGISLDPNGDTFWAFNMYAISQGTPVGTGLGRWGTRWGSFVVVSDATAPTVSVTTPGPTLTGVTTFPTIGGNASDGGTPSTGISHIDLTLMRYSDNMFWNSTTQDWQATPFAIPTSYNAANDPDWVSAGPLPGAANPGGNKLEEGSYLISAKAFDNAGNFATASRVVNVNLQKPTVSITTPDATVTGATQFPAIGGDASDGGMLPGGINTVEFSLYRYSDGKFWDGDSWETVSTFLPSTYNEADTPDWTSSGALPGGANFSEGTFLISALALDKAGNVATATRLVKINIQKPTVSIITPGTTVTGASTFPPVSGNASDGGTAASGIKKVDFTLRRFSDNKFWNGTGWVSASTFLPAIYNAASTPDWSSSGALPGDANLREDSYQIMARALDNAGNQATAVRVVKVNFAKPTVTIETPDTMVTGVSTFPTISGNASDAPVPIGTAASGIKKVEFSLRRSSDGKFWDGTGWVSTVTLLSTTYHEASTPDWTDNVALPADANLTEGSYLISARAFDNAGNVATATRTVTVSDIPSAPDTGYLPPASSAAAGTRLTDSAAFASNDSISLTFSGALPTGFSVSVNGFVVASSDASADATPNTVTLLLSAGALQEGDAVAVSWNGGSVSLTAQ